MLPVFRQIGHHPEKAYLIMITLTYFNGNSVLAAKGIQLSQFTCSAITAHWLSYAKVNNVTKQQGFSSYMASSTCLVNKKLNIKGKSKGMHSQFNYWFQINLWK